MKSPDRPTAADGPASLVLAGAGKMGGAMLEGWLAAGLDPARIAVLDPNPSAALAASAGCGFRLNPPAADVAPPEVFVLATKPQALNEAAPALRPLAGPGTLVISIVAGKTVADLARAFPEAGAIVRAMPNLPASIGRGASGAYAERRVTARQRGLADALLAEVGLVEWVETEELIDAVTALSGSGPAYLFHLVECLTEAGVAAGLAPDLSGRLAQATMVGAAELLDRSGLPPGQLRENVTSPGGTTGAALAVLRAEDGLAPLMRRAVLAAKGRAAELSG